MRLTVCAVFFCLWSPRSDLTLSLSLVRRFRFFSRVQHRTAHSRFVVIFRSPAWRRAFGVFHSAARTNTYPRRGRRRRCCCCLYQILNLRPAQCHRQFLCSSCVSFFNANAACVYVIYVVRSKTRMKNNPTVDSKEINMKRTQTRTLGTFNLNAQKICTNKNEHVYMA